MIRTPVGSRLKALNPHQKESVMAKWMDVHSSFVGVTTEQLAEP